MKKLLMLAFSVMLLTGCLIPEKFSSKVIVKSDGSYTFKYSGTAIHGLALAGMKDPNKKNKERIENDLSIETEKFKKMPEIKSIKYLGSAKYNVNIEANKKKNEPYKVFDLFFVSTDKQGIMTITSKSFTAKDKSTLDQLGIVVDGELEVNIPNNAEVVSQNANSAPTLGFGSYVWKIGNSNIAPTIKIRLK